MMEHEAKANTNIKTFVALIFLVIAIILSAATCTYMLVFYFSSYLVLYCMIMLAVGFILVDLLIARTFYCLIITSFLWCKQKRAAWKQKKYLQQILLQKQIENFNKRFEQGNHEYEPRVMKKEKR
jgi:hypothetical protein